MPYLLVILGVIARLVPHPWNFAPIGAIGLFAGAHCRLRTAWAVPLSSLLIADLLTGFYEPMMMIFVYLGFMAGPLVGRILLSTRRSITRVGSAVWLSATLFFVLSNFGAWIVFYPQTTAGLIECYIRAIPFYGVTLLGDSVYAAVLFGGRELLRSVRTPDHAIRG